MAGLVEKLVLLVGKAFYSDEHLVVLRALLREKFLKDDEMGNAVNLQTRQVRKIMTELHQEHMVSQEVLNDKRLGGSSSTTYWYIDYKYFVDVVQYRLYVMHEHLKDSEQLEIERQTFQCKDPDCGREYTALEAQLLLMPGQFQFHCGHCNEPLIECDNNDRLEHIQNLQRKFKDQMNKQTNTHEGIYEVLRRIGDFVREGHTLPSNLPSENRAAGIGGNSTRLAAGAGGGRGGAGGGGGGGGGSGAGNSGGGRDAEIKNSQSYLYPYGAQAQEIIVDIDGNDHGEDDYLMDRKRKGDELKSDKPVKEARALPEFLQGSTISGHLAAKHTQNHGAVEPNGELGTPRTESLQSMEQQFAQNGMSEQQRQELFKKAYMAELERYNEENKDKEEVQVQVDKQGWDAEMNADAVADDEELEDIEWEWCETMHGDKTGLLDTEVLVHGNPKKLNLLTDDDLLRMSKDEFLSCYRLCTSTG